VSTSLVLDNPELQSSFDLEHVDTSDERTGANLGTWDLTNVVVALRALVDLIRTLRGVKGLVYLPLSQSLPGLVRDSLIIRLAALHGWKIAAHLRGSEFRTFYETRPALVQMWIRRTLERVASIAVMGESLRWVFHGLVPADRVVVVHNGTPEPVADGAVKEDRTVLFLSNLRRRKGVVEAVEAARLVTRNETRVRFLFVGEWEDEVLECHLRRRASDADGRIEFRSPVVGAAKDRLLSAASILLFPPREPEGHPRVVIEALAAGVPVVATNRGAIAETIVDGESGFVLPEPTPAALAERVLVLLRDSRLRERMSRMARSRYLERFTQSEADHKLAEWLVAVSQQP
jgi:glycosyltransferase involved in cell wall biosynthesis